VGRKYSCWILNLLVHHITSKLWKVKIILPHKPKYSVFFYLSAWTFVCNFTSKFYVFPVSATRPSYPHRLTLLSSIILLLLLLLLLLLFSTTHCSLKAYCAILVRRSNFRHQASPLVSPRESTQRRKVELWGEKCPVILPKCRFTRYI